MLTESLQNQQPHNRLSVAMIKMSEQGTNPKLFSLRPASDEDKELCYSIHRASMLDIVAQVFSWDEDDQRTRFAREWDPSELQIVVVDDTEVGVIAVVYRPDHILLSGIELVPAFQGRGIGTALIKGLQSVAAKRCLPLHLGVFVPNKRAKALYDSLGFKEIERSEIKIQMRWDSGGQDVSSS